ncbi:MAG: hypothetical protein JST01_27770 [Cyanobacteria bacterium SZAS TMP-1]|nr:hypothetical protein [Cyanobacteria bacterium SZAS TMP-1]
MTIATFYRAEAQEVQDKSRLKEKPDVVLLCRTYDQITVTKGPVDDQGSHPQRLSQDALKAFLKDKMPKDRIAFYLEKGIDWEEPSGADKLAAFEAYAESLGYKVLTIIGCRAFWVPVIYDSTRGGHQRNLKEPEPTIITPAIDSVHPVLKTPIFGGFKGKVIDNCLIKQLNASEHFFLSPVPMRGYPGWSKKAEDEVVRTFCRLVPRRTSAQIEKLAGAPTAKLKGGGCWEDPNPVSENWLYLFGYSDTCVRLAFRNERCIQAKLCSPEELSSYHRWYKKRIEEFAMIGKTKREIDNFMNESGSPATPEDSNYGQVSNHSLIYHITDRWRLFIELRDGKCVSSQIMFLSG